MVRVKKDFPYFLADGAAPWFPGYSTGDAFLGKIFFEALNLGSLTASLYTLEGYKKRQLY